MPSYDPAVIERFASDLYRRADNIVILSTVSIAAVGAALGALANGRNGAFLGAAIGAVVGLYFGQQRAFSLRLQAQTALCQVQIERNTRPATVAPPKALVSAKDGLLTNEVQMENTAHEPVGNAVEQMGTCSSCNARIPIASTNCPNCNASFGGRSKWRVVSGP